MTVTYDTRDRTILPTSLRHIGVFVGGVPNRVADILTGESTERQSQRERERERERERKREKETYRQAKTYRDSHRDRETHSERLREVER